MHGAAGSAGMKNTKLDAALNAAARGFRVFPVCRDSKIPWAKGWQQAATTDPEQIKTWWVENPAWNIGVATGGGLVVVDVDVKNGKPGAESLAMLEMMGLPETLRVKTPTGGLHVYLQVDGKQHSGREGNVRDLPGLDTRGDGNLVLWHGSYIGRNCYEIIDDRTPTPCPAWLFDIIEAKSNTTRTERVDDFRVEPDLPQNVERAIAWLQGPAPEAVEGDSGDHTTFFVAAELRSLGVSEGMALELLGDHWNEQKASPPWQPDELEKKIANAYQYGQGSFGGKTAAGEFDAVEIPSATLEQQANIAAHIEKLKAPPAANRPRFHTFSLAESIDRALTNHTKPLVDGLLDQGTLAVVYGKPNCGKSFVALDIAGCVASGRPWNGHATESGLTVYIAAEGGAGIHRRVRALAVEKSLPLDVPFAIAPCSVDLFSTTADLRPIIAHIKSLEHSLGAPARLVVVDTLARVFGGGDENSGKDMGQLLTNLDAIREATGATVLVVHHSGKDSSKGSRGHSSLLGAVDTEIEIADRKIRTTKQRDHEPLEPEIRFELRTVVVGRDASDRPLTSCVVRYLLESEFDPLPLNPTAERMLEALVSAIATRPSASGVTELEWMCEYIRSVDPTWKEGDGHPRGCSTVNLRTLRREVLESGHAKKSTNGLFLPA
jgi:hypothetical protein